MHEQAEGEIASLEAEIAELRKQMFDMKLLPNQGHACDGFCLGTCLEGTRLSQKLERSEKEIASLTQRESNYLETIGQDTRTIKGLRLEVAILEQKLEKAIRYLQSIAKPALGGKEQQYRAQQALKELSSEKGGA